MATSIEELKTEILKALESRELRLLDLDELRRLARYRRDAKELGLTDYENLDLCDLKTLVNEVWATYTYNPEVYQDLDDYARHLKDSGATGSAYQELMDQASEDYEDEEGNTGDLDVSICTEPGVQ